MTILTCADVTEALIAMVAAGTGRAVGGAQRPFDADPPFAVVYPLPGGNTWGPGLVAPDGSGALLYQITSVAISRADAETHADVIRAVLLERHPDGSFVTPLVVGGATVIDREHAAFGGVAEERGVFNAREQYLIHITSG